MYFLTPEGISRWVVGCFKRRKKKQQKSKKQGGACGPPYWGPILLAPLVPSPLTLGQSWGFLRVPESLGLALASRWHTKVGLTTFGSPRVVRATPLRSSGLLKKNSGLLSVIVYLKFNGSWVKNIYFLWNKVSTVTVTQWPSCQIQCALNTIFGPAME